MAEKSTKEETVEYKVFPALLAERNEQDVVNILQEIYLIISDILGQYIWQNEPFKLKPSFNSHDDCKEFLFGSTKYGDNVEDEWCIVYMLLTLTKQIPGLVAQINDNDGEFLLIETADFLPKWLEPETAENRVFLFDGKLHIIPMPTNPAELSFLPSGTPQLATAVECIRHHSHVTQASDNIQAALQQRMKNYPGKLIEYVHRAHCYIPAPLAAVLDTAPELVAPMVQAFYYRDPIDLKACVTFTHFKPGTRVMRQVKMTKCLYAQLSQQQFTPDRRSGYTIPDKDDPTFKSHDLGVKLVHGAEILCSRCGSGLSPGDDLSCDPKWLTFLESLKQKDYFKGEIEGSQLYKKLLDDAKKFYQTSASLQAGDDSSPGKVILTVLQNITFDVEEMRKQEKFLDPPDDDSWLTLSPDQLDDMLNDAYRDAFQGQRVTSDLGNVANNMKAFVNKISSHEGAEFPSHEDDDDVTFDPSGFIQTMHKMFDFKDEKLASSDDDMSEYGSEDDFDLDMDPRSNGVDNPDIDGLLGMDNMKMYMEEMDKELSQTAMGKTFENGQTKVDGPVPPPRNKKAQKQNKNTSNQNQHQQASKQQQNASGDFKPTSKLKEPTKAALEEDLSDIDDLEEEFQPVNVDLNLVKNLLESHSSQQGLAGPASNILGSMGLRLPDDNGE